MFRRRSRNFFDFFAEFSKFSRNFLEKQIDFAHRSGALVRPASRELRAVKIPASYLFGDPQKLEKNEKSSTLTAIFRIHLEPIASTGI